MMLSNVPRISERRMIQCLDMWPDRAIGWFLIITDIKLVFFNKWSYRRIKELKLSNKPIDVQSGLKGSFNYNNINALYESFILHIC